jgi:hypothetical protein
MSSFPRPWALCGGWAVDSWLGYESRDHHDTDLAAFEADQLAVYEHMAAWQLIGHDDHVADDSEEIWNGRRLHLPAHIHARSQDGFELEFHLNEAFRGNWVFSHEPRVALPLHQCVEQSPWGVPAVVPEVILYYKALPPGWRGSRPQLRPHDESDCQMLLPHLDQTRRMWLRDAVACVDQSHPWLPRLVV